MTETIGTVARTLSVLRVIAEAKGSVGVKDVADALQLPMSTSHRLLDLLLEAGFVEKEKIKRRYAVGAEFFRLANLVTHKTSLATRVQPLLDELTRETGETALFGAYLAAQQAVAYAAKSDSPQSLRYRIDLFQQASLEWGATGIAILAFLPDQVQADVLAHARPSPITGRRVARAAFSERLATVRRDGFAVTEGEKLPELGWHRGAARGHAGQRRGLDRPHHPEGPLRAREDQGLRRSPSARRRALLRPDVMTAAPA